MSELYTATTREIAPDTVANGMASLERESFNRIGPTFFHAAQPCTGDTTRPTSNTKSALIYELTAFGCEYQCLMTVRVNRAPRQVTNMNNKHGRAAKQFMALTISVAQNVLITGKLTAARVAVSITKWSTTVSDCFVREN